jgi:LCP family protein required for cell wall assembly
VITNRINSAYTYGGAQLMVETIKRLFGITVNHVFVTSFPKFKRAVDELGCVYMGVDRRYYHVNEPGGEQYFEINLQPGYQRMCGRQALEFVANRHQDTSLTRDARDQRFLLEVKAQYGASLSLVENSEKFERILGKTVETDNALRGKEQVLDLLELLVESEGKPVRQIHFNVNLLPSYDTASERQIHESVQSFLRGTALIRKPKLSNVTPHPHRAAHRGSSPRPTLPSLQPTTVSELDHARSQAPNLPFALEYPRARESFAGAEPDTLRLYAVRDEQGHIHPIYVIVIDRGELGQFYDVQGTSWPDPPLLSNPSQTVRVGSRTYELFYTGEQVRVIAWHDAGAVYWIENTLTGNVSPGAMLAMAEQTIAVIHSSGASHGVPAASPSSRSFNLPPRTAAATSLISKVGAALGFAGLVVVALLALCVFARQRELGVLREQVAQAMALEARQRPLLAAVGIPHAEPVPTGIPDARAPTIYHTRRSWRRGVLAAVAVAIVGVLIAFGIHLLHVRSSSSTPALYTLPVAVFNASSTPGTAHRIAATLKANRIHIERIGDINASLSPGTHVLYPPGAEEEARRVARLLPGPSPTVGPIQPPVQNTIGRHHEIVVVLD